ncbi:MAG: HAD family hydrolase [Promethearchaeota archaeon]
MNGSYGFALDFDGTIIDSISIVWMIQDKILERYNIQRTEDLDRKIYKRINEILMGENRKKIGKPVMIAIFKLLGLNFFQRIKALIMAGKTWKEESKNILLIEGVEEVFQYFDDNKIPYTIVTTSSTLEVQDRLLFKYPELYEKLKEKIIARDNVINLKPHPESIYKAAELMKVPVSRCIMVGDMDADIALGKAVNTLTIGVATGFLTKEQLKKLGADFVLNSVAEIPTIIEKIEKRLN